ncbi:hypothetical protein [Thetidibacter halocola]|nr:hypothetical protein [Thetidibacter halocola]
MIVIAAAALLGLLAALAAKRGTPARQRVAQRAEPRKRHPLDRR